MFRATYKCSKENSNDSSLDFEFEMKVGDFPTSKLQNSLSDFQKVLNDKISELIIAYPDMDSHLKNVSDEETEDESDDQQEESAQSKRVKV
ncbi:hypothetical protein DSO57_1012518 [Entomophthora muscae]|uniref:Uncharacterized protein n=1 Tax=Entomophthora muscae TaxID=34485 RepID=A0ACC2U473_9FUNG|nr:hypothetical protein DSO57_1012518 [Entomophthora muscae]